MTKTNEGIVSAPVVMLMEQMMGIPDLQTSHPAEFAYPDGSLHYSDPGACDALRLEMVSLGLGGQVEIACMRGLMIDSRERLFTLLYPTNYQSKLGHNHLKFSVASGRPVSEEERRNPVAIIVEFKRALKSKERERYLAYLKTWTKSVEKAGVGGEGPAWITSNEIAFAQNWVWFEVDRSKSGLNTLNWLALVHLNFGMAVVPVQSVLFNMPAESDPRNTRNLIREAHYAPLSELLGAIVRPIGMETEGEGTAEGNIDEETYYWSYSSLIGMETPFPVDFDSTVEWDGLEFAIELASNTTSNEREYLCRFIESWLELAGRGAFGGRGTKCNESPVFLEDQRTLKFYVNMGDVDEIASMTPFFRGLVSIHHQMPIKLVRVS
jgi:hypothetical protein